MRYPTCHTTSYRAETPSADKAFWNTAHWFALYTRSRHEKYVNEELEKKRIETFLPLREITRQWSDRKKVITEPLFKGYLFVRIPLAQRWQVLNTVGAVNFIHQPSNALPQVVSEKDLLSVKKFLDEGIQVDPFPYLKEGERVYIRSGVFKGVEGFIQRKASHCRLIVSLDLLLQSASVEIDEALVEKI